MQNSSSECAHRLKALADPTRLRVLAVLIEGSRSVGELVRIVDVEQSLLSHHLKILRDAKLVVTSRHAKSIVYSLTHDTDTKIKGDSIDLGCCQISF